MNRNALRGPLQWSGVRHQGYPSPPSVCNFVAPGHPQQDFLGTFHLSAGILQKRRKPLLYALEGVCSDKSAQEVSLDPMTAARSSGSRVQNLRGMRTPICKGATDQKAARIYTGIWPMVLSVGARGVMEGLLTPLFDHVKGANMPQFAGSFAVFVVLLSQVA